MAKIKLAEINHNGVHYELLAEELDPVVFQNTGADTIETDVIVRATAAPSGKSKAKSS